MAKPGKPYYTVLVYSTVIGGEIMPCGNWSAHPLAQAFADKVNAMKLDGVIAVAALRHPATLKEVRAFFEDAVVGSNG